MYLIFLTHQYLCCNADDQNWGQMTWSWYPDKEPNHWMCPRDRECSSGWLWWEHQSTHCTTHRRTVQKNGFHLQQASSRPSPEAKWLRQMPDSSNHTEATSSALPSHHQRDFSTCFRQHCTQCPGATRLPLVSGTPSSLPHTPTYTCSTELG